MNSDRSTLEKLNIVYSHIGVHLYIYTHMFVDLIAQANDDNDYYIGK